VRPVLSSHTPRLPQRRLQIAPACQFAPLPLFFSFFLGAQCDSAPINENSVSSPHALPFALLHLRGTDLPLWRTLGHVAEPTS
jgi:hypothetical protein